MKYLFILALFSSLSSFAQSPIEGMKPLTFASPDVSSLGRYGEIPVGLYTGVPSISIPIFDIKEGDITIPISISYHAGGIRVQDIASSVGLGWSLNAGGMINREVRDVADDAISEDGFVEEGGEWVNAIAGFMQPLYNSPIMKNFLSGMNLPTNSQKNKLTDLGGNEGDSGVKYDGQTDIYSFNVPSGGGKFFFKNNRDIVLLPMSNFKIAKGPFRVTDESGVLYTFRSTGEYTTTQPWNFNAWTPAPQIYHTSWPIETITDKFNNSATFTYSRKDMSYNSFLSESTKVVPVTPVYGQVVISTDKLTTIATHHYTVTFYWGTIRQDYGDGGAYIDNMLDSIKVFNSAGVAIRTANLYHSYFIGSPAENLPGNQWGNEKAHKRLRLDSLVIDHDKAYRFSYNATTLPSRFSRSIDLWGYYNGVSNATYIPTFFGKLEYSGRKKTYRGANRRPDPAFNQACILKRITYPTGGSTDFEYETNDVLDRKNHIVPELVPIDAHTGNFIFSGTSSSIAVTYPYTVRYGNIGQVITISPMLSTTNWWEKVRIEFIDAATGGANFLQDITPYYETGSGDVRTAGIPYAPAGDYLIRVRGVSTYAMVNVDINWYESSEELVDPDDIVTTLGDHFVYPGGTNTISYPITVSDQQGEIRAWSSSNYSSSLSIEIVDAETGGGLFRKMVLPPTTLTPTVTALPNKPGNYVIRARSSDAGAFFHLQIAWKDLGEFINRQVGGLRIKKTTEHDPLTQTDLVTSYSYRFEGNEDLSSGEIFQYPVNHDEEIIFIVDENCHYTYDPNFVLNQVGPYYFTSHSSIATVLNTDTEIGYSSVIVEKGVVDPSRTIYSYTNISSMPDFKLYPEYDFNTTPYISLNWTRGLLLSEKLFRSGASNTFTKVRETINHYTRKNTLLDPAFTSLGIAIKSNAVGWFNGYDEDPDENHYPECFLKEGHPGANIMIWRPYLTVSGWNTLDSTEVKDYANGQVLRTITRMKYFEPDIDSHLAVREKQADQSDGSTVKETFKYAPEFKSLGTGSDEANGIKNLQNTNLISPVIEYSSFVREKGSTIFKLTESTYRDFYPSLGVPRNLFQVESVLPLTDFSATSVISGLITKDSRYQLKGGFTYGVTGKLKELQKAEDIRTAYLWGYDDQYPVAEAVNASAAQLFYTGFESDGITGTSHSGKKYRNAGTYTIPFTPPSDGTVYKMCYWYWSSGNWNFSGELPFSATISQGSKLDDVRVYPAGSLVKTYTYDPGVGITSLCDANNLATHFEYDFAGRLIAIRDNERNLVKTFTYHYQGN